MLITYINIYSIIFFYLCGMANKKEGLKNNVKSTSFFMTLNGNLFFEVKAKADKKYKSVQDYIRDLIIEDVSADNPQT